MTEIPPISQEEVQNLLNKAYNEYSEGTNPRIELTDAQVNYLASIAKKGDSNAREVIVLWGSRLIAPHPAHIQWIKYSSVSPEDMWQEGRIAIMVAIDKYDQSRGYDFGAYAAKIVSNTLGEWAERHSLVISVPRHARRRLRREGVVDETTRLAKAAESLPRYLSSLMSPTEDHLASGDGILAVLADQTDGNSPELEAARNEEAFEVRKAFFSLDLLEQRILYHRHIMSLSLEKTHRILKIGIPVLKGLEEEALVHLTENLEGYLGETKKNESTVLTA